ncbi:UNVERIFIED_CONTAM: hypothetical protein FKN15_042620, partial [Acipenser sinensis]
ERPTFLRRPINQVVLEEEVVEFRCQVQGDPQPTVRWRKDDADLPRGRYDIKEDYMLRIKKASSSDEGTYTCIAENRVGKVEAAATLTVRVLTDRPPPIIRQGPANQTLAVDSLALLKCQALGDPIPTISWLKDGLSLLGKDSRMSLQDRGSLQIKNIRRQAKEVNVFLLYSWIKRCARKDASTSSKNSVSLSWQTGMTGSSPITSYVIEAFSQSVSNSWQTVADHVKMTQFTVRGLRPNTIYLFMVRAVNSQGLSDPSPITDPVRTQDISPPAQGVDHRHVQRELGEVIIRLHNPVVLTPTTIQVTWTMDRQSQFIQGYRVMYRQTSGLSSPSSWQSMDVKVPTERSTVLSNLKKGIVYEIKVRPYFNEFQGMDSDSKTARTTEEERHFSKLSALHGSCIFRPMGSVYFAYSLLAFSLFKQNERSSNWINVFIQFEYKISSALCSVSSTIWCLANETRFDINKTVDAAIRSVVIGGLYSGIQYRVAVAASTSAGVGVKSEPHPIIIGNFKDVIMSGAGSNNSITEQITDVVKQPAFIAGIGGACWVILMGFSIWLYWRRKKRKGLSNYAVQSFTFTPAVTFQRVDGGMVSNGSRPGLLNASDPGYPWLADSWPATSIPGTNGPNDLGNFSRGDALPLVPSQGDKSGTMLSDGAIYSSIDFTTKASYNSPSQIPQATPYATTQILHSNSIHELAVDLPDPQWKASIQAKQDLTGLGYSLPDKTSCNNTLLFIPDYRLAEELSNRMPHNQSQDFSTTSSQNSSERSGSLSGGKGGKKKKNKSGSKPHKTNGSNWVNVPLPPPPVHPLPGTELDHYGGDHQEGGYGNDGWGPPLPVQTYLHQGMEDELEEEDERVPTPPIRGVASSPAMSYGQQSTATLTPSPREEIQPMLQAHLDELTRAYQFDIAKQTWIKREFAQTYVNTMGPISIVLKSMCTSDLPPPPDPPPCQGSRLHSGSGQRGMGMGGSAERTASSLERQHVSCLEEKKSSLEQQTRMSLERQRQAQERVGSMEHSDDMRRLHKQAHGSEDALVPYSKPSFPSPGGHSSSGTSSSKGSTGPRKGEVTRGPHQHNTTDLPDLGYMRTNGQGQYSGELCTYSLAEGLSGKVERQ